MAYLPDQAKVARSSTLLLYVECNNISQEGSKVDLSRKLYCWISDSLVSPKDYAVYEKLVKVGTTTSCLTIIIYIQVIWPFLRGDNSPHWLLRTLQCSFWLTVFGDSIEMVKNIYLQCNAPYNCLIYITQIVNLCSNKIIILLLKCRNFSPGVYWTILPTPDLDGEKFKRGIFYPLKGL